MNDLEMIITVRDLFPKRCGGISSFVTHNSGHTIRFLFDEIWNDYPEKTAYFIMDINSSDGNTIPVQFSGDICRVPVLSTAGAIYIGVTAGETISTHPLRLTVCESIHDQIGDEVDIIEPDAYDRIMEILNKLPTSKPATAESFGSVKAVSAIEDMIAEVGISDDGFLVAECLTEKDMGELLVESGLAVKDKDGNFMLPDGTLL